MGRKPAKPIDCPKCGLAPMVWLTPNNVWGVTCSNNFKPWHLGVGMFASAFNSRAKAVKKWNEKAREAIELKVTRERDKVATQLNADKCAFWVPSEKNVGFYICSNCKYEFQPRQIVCPNCGKKMRPYIRISKTLGY